MSLQLPVKQMHSNITCKTNTLKYKTQHQKRENNAVISKDQVFKSMVGKKLSQSSKNIEN